jgi:hypothetical protein
LWHALRYTAAVVVGVLLASVFGTPIGVHGWSLAVVMVFALAAGKLRPLGGQRTQVPVTALFAFASGGGELDYSLHLVAAVVIGVVCGLLAAVFLAPPMRYRSAEEAVTELSSRVCGLLRDMSAVLRESAPTEQTAEEWTERARSIEGTAERARSTLESGEERAHYNPRRIMAGQQRSLAGFHTMVNILERIGFQARSVVHGLSYAVRSDHYDSLALGFLTAYADLLADSAAAVESFAHDGCIAEARDRYEDLVSHCRPGESRRPRRMAAVRDAPDRRLPHHR